MQGVSRRAAVALSVLAAALVVASPAAADAGKPKLSVSQLGSPPAKLQAGAGFQVAGTVVNKGKRRGTAAVQLFLRSASSPEARGTPAGSTRLERIKSKRAFDAEVSAPATLTPGSYVLAACVRKRGNRGPDRCRLAAAGVLVEGPAPAPPVFTPGARTLGDPILPQIGNGGYDVGHYNIDLDYEPGPNEFDGAVVTIAATAEQNLSQLSLDFQDLPVDAVKVNGAAATFQQVDATPAITGGGTQPMKLVINPASGIPDASQFTIEVDYHGEPQVFTDPDGSDEGWIPSPVCVPPLSCNSHFVVGEPMGSQAWFPSNNHPSDKATYDTTITVPTGQTAVGVGELIAQTANPDGTTTWSWSEDDPTSSYLVTASNGNFDFSGSGTVTEALTGRTLPIYNAVMTLATANSKTAITTLTARNQEMINLLGAHYGPYPLDSYGSLWDNLPSVGYALEVQTKSHFSSLPVGPAPSAGLASVYLHELSHQWWGDAVTLHDWNDLWFNEGWAQLSEWIFGDDSGSDPDSPEDHFDDEYANASPSEWSIAPAVLDNDPAKMFSPSFPTYTRGAMTLEGFREIVGAAAFDQFARDLQTQFAHGNIDTPEFIVFAKQSSGFTGPRLALLDEYFQQWLYGTTQPMLMPDDV